MSHGGILSLISRSNHWLSDRQVLVSQNIANANTPGYKALDVIPFERALSAERAVMQTTHHLHLQATGAAGSTIEHGAVEGAASNHSGNTVSLEREMLTAGEISSRFALGTSVYRSFHRMLITGSR